MTTAPNALPRTESHWDSHSRWVLARRAALVNLIVQIGIVVTGGLVRLTGSGLGCPTWPRCTADSLTPTTTQAEGIHKYIEFGNRTLTGVVLIAAIAVLVLVLRAVRHDSETHPRLVWLAAAPLLLTITQAVLGGITVLTHLSPATVAAHMLVSMVAICVSTVLWLRLRPTKPAQPVPPWVRTMGTAIGMDAAIILCLGTVVTGAGPHSGDADQPARLGVDLALASRIHAAAVWLLILLMLVLWRRLRGLGTQGDDVRSQLSVLAAVVTAQAVVGYLQYALRLPWQLVAVHLLLAALFVVAATALVVATRGGSSSIASARARLSEPT